MWHFQGNKQNKIKLTQIGLALLFCYKCHAYFFLVPEDRGRNKTEIENLLIKAETNVCNKVVSLERSNNGCKIGSPRMWCICSLKFIANCWKSVWFEFEIEKRNLTAFLKTNAVLNVPLFGLFIGIFCEYVKYCSLNFILNDVYVILSLVQLNKKTF